MKSAKRLRVDVNLEELDRVLDGARQAPLSEADCDKLKSALHALAAMLASPRNTEKTSAVLEEPENPEPGDGTQPDTNVSPQPGHGRNGAEAFGGAQTVDIAHQKLTHGDRCPECGKGNVYGQKEPKVLVRIVGQAPLAATVYSLERLRCGACGQVFTAQEPEGVGPEKYDETAAGDDRATQVRQRDPVLPVGKTARSVGDTITGSDAVGGCRRGRRVGQTGAE
jgi:ribosomal protein S27AE